MSEHLRLKWGTLKAWNLESDASAEAFDRFASEGVCVSAAMQRHTPAQEQALCDLIDAVDGPITNDWSGEDMTKDEAKRYVREYRQAQPPTLPEPPEAGEGM